MSGVKSNVFDLYSVAFFGFIGYVLVKLRCEPAPLLLGFVLGRAVGRLAIRLRSRQQDTGAPSDFLALALIALGYRSLSLSATAHGPVKAMILDLDTKKAEATIMPLLKT